MFIEIILEINNLLVLDEFRFFLIFNEILLEIFKEVENKNIKRSIIMWMRVWFFWVKL